MTDIFFFFPRLRNGNAPFEVKIKIPRMILDAKYTSTGILIVIPANGNGTFHAEMGKNLVRFCGKEEKGVYKII